MFINDFLDLVLNKEVDYAFYIFGSGNAATPLWVHFINK